MLISVGCQLFQIDILMRSRTC